MSRPNRGTVSLTSAQRFAARARARRRRRSLTIFAVLLLVVATGWGVLRSPWATVQRIEVSGTHRVPVAAVRAAAEPELGRPMLLTRDADVASRVGRLRLVRSVQVRRVWPGVIRVRVVERVPVAALPQGTGLNLVDEDGVVIESSVRTPAGLPRLDLNLATAGVGAMRGCLQVLSLLPPEVSRQVRSIGAVSLDGIWLKLAGGVRVEWGSSSDTVQKATVLSALEQQHASHYDVSSLDTPAVRGK